MMMMTIAWPNRNVDSLRFIGGRNLPSNVVRFPRRFHPLSVHPTFPPLLFIVNAMMFLRLGANVVLSPRLFSGCRWFLLWMTSNGDWCVLRSFTVCVTCRFWTAKEWVWPRPTDDESFSSGNLACLKCLAVILLQKKKHTTLFHLHSRLLLVVARRLIAQFSRISRTFQYAKKRFQMYMVRALWRIVCGRVVFSGQKLDVFTVVQLQTIRI